MFCAKCGRETQDQLMFCPSCSEEMLNYPVDSETPIQLPLRSEAPPAKRRAPRRRLPSAEELLPRTQGTLRLFVLLSVVLLIAFLLAAGLALYLLDVRGLPLLCAPF